jgi:26 proteasome complex subunit DSS1
MPLCSRQEDDEFEEFEQQEWTTAAQDAEDPAMWQDGWEDDEEDDNFTAQLRAELEASESAAGKPEAMKQ